MRAAAALTFFGLVALARPALAADPSTPPVEHAASETEPAPAARAAPSTGERALAGAAAVVPGVVVHGAGHYVAGESTTGTRLLIAQGAGLGLMAGGLVALVATGASRYVAGPAAGTMVLGSGLFITSYLADVYGTLSPDSDAAERRVQPPPWIETELGYRHISDPIFAYEHFVVERLSFQSGSLRLTPSAWFSSDGDNARYGLEAGYRVLGAVPSASQRAVTADRLDGVLGVVHHRFVTERFVRTSMDVLVDTRYDLGHVGSTLRGAFVEAGIGYSFGLIDYDVTGVDAPSDFDDLLLARFGFGAVFRGASHPGSEARVYYDHRHDDFAGGLILEGIPSGVAGHFGAEARWFFLPEWGLGVQAEVGSARVAGASLLFRQAGEGPKGRERNEP
ncbi:MAG TPA: hypothetical protein VFZ53_04995 [Polyangiaceae bacterium]